MAALNRVQLLGYVGQEPKITQTKEGKPVAFASLATNASFLKNDEWQTVTEWHHLVLFGKLADVSTRLKKGGLVFVEGRLSSNLWTDKEGVKQRTVSIVVQALQRIDNVKPKEVLEEENKSTAKEYMEEMRNVLVDSDISF
jgi:single-strand DNA-binding protein